ncbi:MAG: hypothetical protein M0P95_11460 [Sulfuritalea sp.]|jgi:hypothetical protein|nr:hypothetical protein [Sulfuritalea sp.]
MGILSGLGRWLGLARPPDPATRQAIERAVESVDPLLKLVFGYERKLAPAVSRALDYCAELVAAIPGPVDISSRAFGADPLVHAIFAGPGDIAEMLGRSREVRQFLADPGQGAAEEFFALLGMRPREKTVMGAALRDGMVQTDLPQQLLYFADHTLWGLGGSYETTRQRLQAAAFDSLSFGFADRVTELREQQAAAALAAERLLQGFVEWLAASREHLYLQPMEVCVDRMGVIWPNPGADANCSVLKFPKLFGRDRRQWTVLVARINRQDAVDALQRQDQANRYLLI